MFCHISDLCWKTKLQNFVPACVILIMRFWWGAQQASLTFFIWGNSWDKGWDLILTDHTKYKASIFISSGNLLSQSSVYIRGPYGSLCALAMAYCFLLHNGMDFLLLICAEKTASGLSRFSQLVFNSFFVLDFLNVIVTFFGLWGIWCINPPSPHSQGKKRT